MTKSSLPLPPAALASWDQARAEGEAGLGKLLQVVRTRLAEGDDDVFLVAAIMKLAKASKQDDVAAMLALALLRLAKRTAKDAA